jgi:hypothetical protein
MTEANKRMVLVGFCAALAPLVSACGSSSGSCGKVQPCGGDVVGDWNISAACVDNAVANMELPFECPGAMVRVTGLNVSGTATFTAGLTYTRTQTMSGSVQMTFAPSCLAMEGITPTCAQIDAILQLQLAQQPGTFQSASCSGSATCTCSFTTVPETQSDSGTYVTSGNTLTLTSSAGAVDADQYCVQGNELHIPEVDMTMAMGTIQADTVLTRR